MRFPFVESLESRDADLTDSHSISVLVPALNEAGNIEGAIRDIVSAAEEVFDDYEVLIVNDGSTDNTGEEAEGLARENSKIRDQDLLREIMMSPC